MSKKPKVVIVAGGLATRMRPITEKIPKCMVDVNGIPLIEHQINYFKESGYTDFIFCVSHLSGLVKEYFGNGSTLGVNIKYSEEPNELLGSAGAVKLIEQCSKEAMVVFYGDNLTNLDFDKFLMFHNDKKSSFSIFLREKPENYSGSSLIMMDEENMIKTFIEKPSKEEFEMYKDQKQYINNGIYIIEPEIFIDIPKNTKYDFGKDLIPKLLKSGKKMYGYCSEDFFIELGRVEKYESFLNNFKGRERVLDPIKAVFLDRDGVINENVKDLNTPEKFNMLDGVGKAIKLVNDSNFLAIITTNQPIISKGFLSFDVLDEIHQKMKRGLEREGAHVDAVYVCPHHPEKGFDGEIAELKIDCDCRKPKPGLILKAIREYNIDKTQSWIVGDSMSDIVAGRSAGIKTILVTQGGGSGRLDEKDCKNVKPDLVCKNLLDAVKKIL